MTEGRPWRRAAFWLLGLGAFFYASYGLANWLASLHSEVPVVVFGWERHVPFLGWTIIPYWSVNLFYAASLFVPATRAKLDRHAARLLTAQVIAVTCFIAFPLRFSFERPETTGLPGFLFAVLGGFDRPFNQAPSLHIALLVILWDLYARHAPGRLLRWALHIWFTLIGLSVLTTYQHHAVDVPTGALLGLLCLWLWPERGPSPLAARIVRDRRRRSLASCYGVGALALAGLAAWGGGWWLWLFWPAVSCALVALNYALAGAAGFGKAADGTVPLATRLLLVPYTLAARVNAQLWTRRAPGPCHVVDGVWLGRLPAGRQLAAGPFRTVVDLCAEIPLPPWPGRRVALPSLDLVPPPTATLQAAAEAIEAGRSHGPVLVCCALGYARSAAAVSAWLVRTGRAADAGAAAAMIRAARPHVVLPDAA
ncbi:phosphatase PAP2/dual specificity phosphatase family protein [Muricoccus radiodurans]|uniref:phosphatase PAP2/dual specificity phosphatase family protein n=1 Tax=Muricoccus radiodurans TaxID=2231721 RepID=UPI003CEBE297